MADDDDDENRRHKAKSPVLPTIYENDDDDEKEDSDSDEEIEDRDPKEERVKKKERSAKDFRKQSYDKSIRQSEFQAQFDAHLKKEEEERLRAAEATRLADLWFPNKFGWFYTNGYYQLDTDFGIKPELLDDQIKQEVEFEERRRKREPETFTAKFKRNFWPPHYLCKKEESRESSWFRTRGVYLHWPEILANYIPEPENDFEKCMSKLKRNTDPTIMDEDDYEEGGAGDSGYWIRGQRLSMNKVDWDDWYYDDEDGQFYRKVIGLEIDYYFDSHNSCWRRKAGWKRPWGQITPYDFYYDHEQGDFFPRDFFKGNDDLILFDENLGIWKLEKENENKKLSLTGAYTAEDFFFDEEKCLWKQKVVAPVEEIRIENDENGRRWVKRHMGQWRGSTGNSPDDYYWDEITGTFKLRPELLAGHFLYNTIDGAWRPKVPPQKHVKKHHRKPKDYFFDDGLFKLKTPGKDHLYRQWKYAKIYVGKDLPKSGLLPQDYYYDYDKSLWLPRSLRLTAKTKNDDLPWRGNKPDKQKRILSRDDWYFDTEEGIYTKKTKIGLQENVYYFDVEEKTWKSTELRNKNRVYILPGDFYFTGEQFQLKDKNSHPETYAFDEKHGVYRLKGSDFDTGHPDHFYFDYEKESWKSRTNEDQENTITLDSSGHYVKKFPVRRSPDDYYFDESEGQFHSRLPEIEYMFDSNEGCYKLKGSKGTGRSSSQDYYFDDHQGRWFLKVKGEDAQYYYDQNNKFFRLDVTKTKTGLGATDYYFSPNVGKWFPVRSDDPNANPTLNRGRAKAKKKIQDEKLNWDPARKYDKPWLRAAPIRYSLETNDEDEDMKTARTSSVRDKPKKSSTSRRSKSKSKSKKSKSKPKTPKVTKTESKTDGWQGFLRPPLDKPARGRTSQ